MTDESVIRRILDEMGIEPPPGADDPRLGPDLGMDQLEIKRLRQLIELDLGARLPEDFRISRQETVRGLVEAVNGGIEPGPYLLPSPRRRGLVGIQP